MIGAEHQNSAIMTAAEYTLDSVKTIIRKMEICNGDHEALACTKEHGRCSDCLRTQDFIKQLQEKIMEVLNNTMRSFVRKMATAISPHVTGLE